MKSPPQGRSTASRNGPLQVRELLARIADHHHVLARYFHELSGAREEPLASFATLARWRHASVAANLEHYARADGGRELEGWIREVPDGRVRELIEQPPQANATTDDIVDYALEIERAIAGVYEQLQAHVQSAGAHEMISNLTTLEHGVAMRLNSARLELGYG